MTTPSPSERGRKLLAGMRAKRGYVLGFHELLAEHLPDVLETYDAYYSQTWLTENILDAKTKELVAIGIHAASLTSAERKGPITARACGSDAAATAASTGSTSPWATCGTPAARSTASTAAVRGGGRIEWTVTPPDRTSAGPGEQVRHRVDRLRMPSSNCCR